MMGRLGEPRATSSNPAARNAVRVPVQAKASGRRLVREMTG